MVDVLYGTPYSGYRCDAVKSVYVIDDIAKHLCTVDGMPEIRERLVLNTKRECEKTHKDA